MKETRSPVLTLLSSLRRDRFFLALLLVLVGLTVMTPANLPRYSSLVDWPTIGTLAGLLMLTKGIELSGALAHLGHRLIGTMSSLRGLALFLVASTALLSTVLTNDVALFVVVPLTLGLANSAKLPIGRLVIFEALAANAGSTLTPIGNPQNLFLWHLSGLPFERFVLALLPLTLLLMFALAAMTWFAFARTAIALHGKAQGGVVDRRLLWGCLILFPVFLILTDLHHVAPALLVVLAAFLMLRRGVVAESDWGLILVFILMFIDLRLVAEQPAVRVLLQSLELGQSQHLYLAGVALSQGISNVPAAILLAEYSKDWRVIAWGVNVGGFGFVLGSLANLIALRMLGQPGSWLRFHAWSAPFVVVAGALGWAWLFVLG
ncbi:MAG: Citrate transporter [Herminiimonas sp.]|nr:Citrate transporter [Herminiimonas sp.]